MSIKAEKGISTILILMVLSTAFVLIGFVFAFRGIAKLEEAETILDGDRSLFAAESGVDEALLQLRRNPGFTTTSLTISPGITAEVNIVATAPLGDNPPAQCSLPNPPCSEIVSVGKSGSSIRTIRLFYRDDDPAAGGYEGFHANIFEKRYF